MSNLKNRAEAPRAIISKQLGYLPTLDGWRALAICLVIGSHSVWMLQNNGSKPARVLASLFNHAGYGVDIFFALSGFLITTLLLREKVKSGSISLSQFYVKRIFRILPVVLTYILIFQLLTRSHILVLPQSGEVLASLLFARNYADGSWYTGHFWSLSIEEQFYAFIPLIILLLKPKALLRTSLALIVACIAVRTFELAHDAYFHLPQFRTESRVDALLWGSVLAQLVQRPAFLGWFRKHVTLPRLAGVLAVTVVCLFTFEDQGVRRTIVGAVLPWVIVYTVVNPTTLLGRFLELGALKMIGRMSFSIYVWQMMFLVPERSLGIVQDFPLNLVMPFALAYVSFRWLETPAIKLGHRLATKQGRLAPVMAAA